MTSANMGMDAPLGQPDSEPHEGQLRFAERFARAYAGMFLHVHRIAWHEYDGARWAECRDGGEYRAVVALLKDAIAEIPLIDDPDKRARFLKEIHKLENSAGVNGILSLAQSQEDCSLDPLNLDDRPDLLNTRSATINIITGERHDPDPGDHLSKVTNARFDPDARSELFDRFMATIQPDPEMRAYLARQLGSALLGKVREQKLFIWHGDGANGKGTLRDVLRETLGDYAIEVPPEILLASKYGQQGMAPERMRLKGARFAFCSEIAENAKMDEPTMKKLTGGDPVNAKLLYKNPIDFDPSHTLFMLTNYLPRVKGDDPAVWRRIEAVPFSVVVPVEDRDPELAEKLKANPEAVLAWLWRGWLDYQKNGLNPPEAVLKATERYQMDSDVLSRFLADEAAVCVGYGSAGSGALYKAFTDWLRMQGEDTEMTNKAFSAALEKRGYEKKHTKHGAQWQSIMIAAREEDEDRSRWAA